MTSRYPERGIPIRGDEVRRYRGRIRSKDSHPKLHKHEERGITERRVLLHFSVAENTYECSLRDSRSENPKYLPCVSRCLHPAFKRAYLVENSAYSSAFSTVDLPVPENPVNHIAKLVCRFPLLQTRSRYHP